MIVFSFYICYVFCCCYLYLMCIIFFVSFSSIHDNSNSIGYSILSIGALLGAPGVRTSILAALFNESRLGVRYHQARPAHHVSVHAGRLQQRLHGHSEPSTIHSPPHRLLVVHDDLDVESVDRPHGSKLLKCE